ncbi:MAG TPA: histidine kinase [Micromonospora sp.]
MRGIDITRRDLLVMAVAAMVGLGLFAIGAYDRTLHPAFVLLSALVVSVAAGLSRGYPFVGLALGTATVLVDQVIGPSLAVALIFTQVLHDACLYGPPWLSRVLLWVGTLVTIGITVGVTLATKELQAAMLGVLVALILIVPVSSGQMVRHHRDLAALERERAEQMARMAELDYRQAVAAERTRMARELHDVVANHLGVIAIHSAGALALPPGSDEQVRQALTVIRESAVQGMAEMRESIRLLREGTDPDSVSEASEAIPTLDGIPRLIERAQRAGLTVSYRVKGEQPQLPVSVQLAAYRIVQEGLTNALKHGTGSAELTLAYTPDRLIVTIVNQRGERSTFGTGSGLVGMRERVALLGGEFMAGPDGDLFRVRVALPLAGKA